MTVEAALTSGRFSDWRRIEKTQTGNVWSKPPVKNEISKLLNDQAKAKIAGRRQRRGDLRDDDVAQHLQLRGAEVDRRLLERALEADQPRRDDRDDEREGDDQVHQRDRLQRQRDPELAEEDQAGDADDQPGDDEHRAVKPGDAPRPKKRRRVSPQAAAVPRTSETTVTNEATRTELTIASCACWLFQASSYQWVVKPSQGSEMIDESLNENSASISTGPNRITSTIGDQGGAGRPRRRAAHASVLLGEHFLPCAVVDVGVLGLGLGDCRLRGCAGRRSP